MPFWATAQCRQRLSDSCTNADRQTRVKGQGAGGHAFQDAFGQLAGFRCTRGVCVICAHAKKAGKGKSIKKASSTEAKGKQTARSILWMDSPPPLPHAFPTPRFFQAIAVKLVDNHVQGFSTLALCSFLGFCILRPTLRPRTAEWVPPHPLAFPPPRFSPGLFIFWASFVRLAGEFMTPFK